jgi:uncharacterized protein YidB (DUF937 family)
MPSDPRSREKLIRKLSRDIASAIYDDPVDDLEYEVDAIYSVLASKLPDVLKKLYPQGNITLRD